VDLSQTLFEIERELGAGDAMTYARLLTEDAVVVVPGMRMDKRQTVAAMAASPGWDSMRFDDERCSRLGDHVALLNYLFTGRRGDDFEYSALMGSVYVRQQDGWRMAFHQQTPVGSDA
jgi:ketosteroid isomerase-like protein